MKNKNLISVLVVLISIISVLATSTGIFSAGGPDNYEYETIRGEGITIYGTGLYKHMSADVAIQGIAQDYITLFVGVPLLLISLFFARKSSLRGLFVLSGTLLYFFLTYLFYTAMAMYNEMFLAYVFLLGVSFYTLILSLFSFDLEKVTSSNLSNKIFKPAGLFLIINASLIVMLWLSVVIPPLVNGTIFPKEVQHYTTLIVQGFDLGLFLPAAYITGYLAVRKNQFGLLFAPIYLIFLSILMTALVSKIIFMASAGANVIPVVFIMPTIALTSIIFSFLILKNFRHH
jgi:hypothetical protein